MTILKASRDPGHTASVACRCALEPSRSFRRAFSLVELVIVVGIIVLLVGLTIAVLTTLSRGSETRRTADMLTLIDQAYSTWKTTSERDVSYGIDNSPSAGAVYEIQQTAVGVPPGTGTDHEPTDILLEILNKHAPAKEILANISSSLLAPPTATHSETRLLDAWETEVITVFPGRLWVNGDTYAKDEDGTIRTEFENAFGMCVNRRVRFVSAGPDGQFGDYAAAAGSQLRTQADDNLYSYPLEAP